MIDENEFVRLLENEFEDVDEGSLKPDSSYREIPNFSSMYALIIIAFIDNEFDVLLTGEDLRSTETIADLYAIIQKKLNK
ncbi:MAG: acyl carrier protein [Flavobacteriales bacterium]|nr:acyl carrier protein [Flavobacteriales bacterium]